MTELVICQIDNNCALVKIPCKQKNAGRLKKSNSRKIAQKI